MKQLLSVMALCFVVGIVSAQDVLFDVEDYEVLTPDNISQLRHLAYIGTGAGAGPDWSADNKTLYINTSTGQWRYDVTQMHQPPTFAPYPSLYSSVDTFVRPSDELDFKAIAISPDRQYIVEAVQEYVPESHESNGAQGILIVRERDSGKEIVRLTADAITGFRTITGLLTLPTFGVLGLTYFRDHNLYRWSPETNQETFMLPATMTGGELIFSPDATYLATVRFGGQENMPTPVRVWDMTASPAKMLFEKEFPNFTYGMYRNSLNVDFSPDGKTLIASRLGSNVRIWDIASRGMSYRDTNTHREWEYGTYQVVYSPDARYIGGCQYLFGGGYAFLRDAVTGEDLAILDGFPGDGTFSCIDVFFHPNQRDFLVLNPFGTLESWPIADLISRQSVTIEEAPLIFGDDIIEQQERPTSAALNASGTVVALSSEDGLIHLFDYETRFEITVLENSSRFLSLLFNASNDDLLITGDVEGQVKVWDLATRTQKTLITIPEVPANYEEYPSGFYANGDQFPLRMNAEGTLLAAYDGWYLLNTTNEVVRKSIMPDAFSPDGRFIVTIANGDISFWGVPKKK